MRHKCLASFNVFVLYFTISAFIGFAQVRLLTKAEFLTKILAESGMYNNIPEMISTATSGQKDQGKETSLESKILLRLVGQTIDPKNLEQEVEKNTPLFLGYITGQRQTLDVSFDLAAFKNNLVLKSPTVLPAIIDEELKDLQPCPADFQASQNELPDCLASNLTSEQMKTQMINSFNVNDLVGQIPNTYQLSQTIKNPEKLFAPYKLAFKLLKIGFWASLILSLILLGLLALLGKSYWPSIPRWLGLSLVLPGGSILAMDLAWKYSQKIIQDQLVSGFIPDASKFIQPLFQAIDKNSSKPGLIISGIIFGLGVILVIFSYVIPHPPEPKPAPKTNPPAAPPANPPQPVPAKPA